MSLIVPMAFLNAQMAPSFVSTPRITTDTSSPSLIEKDTPGSFEPGVVFYKISVNKDAKHAEGHQIQQ